MQQQEIVIHLSKLSSDPSTSIFSIRTQDVIIAIVRRMGEEALTLTANELELAVEEVKEAIHHDLDHRDYIDMGLDAWEITRHL